MSHRQISTLIAITLAVFASTLFMTSTAAAVNYEALRKLKGLEGDGIKPGSAPIVDAAGNLYGTTYTGGNKSNLCDGGACGTVYMLSPNPDGSWSEKIIYAFQGGSDGANTYAPLIFDQAGNLYGTTLHGGTANFGTVFELTPNPDGSWTHTVLWNFGNGEDGQYSFAGLVLDSSGNLYGTTYDGGPVGCGTAFRLSPDPKGRWTYTRVHSFGTKSGDGCGPYSGVILDGEGNLYGTTAFATTFTLGIVFKLTAQPDGSWAESVLHGFTGGGDGGIVYGGLALDANGVLYGTTTSGGVPKGCDPWSLGCGGVAFKLTPKRDGSWKFTRLRAFRGAGGTHPVASLVLDEAGNLYGTNRDGGRGVGTAFELSPNPNGSWKFTRLHTFKGKDGESPFGGLTLDKTGNLYGSTNVGGHGYGVIFKITP